MTVLHVMSLIIERMQADIQPHISCLVRYLPSLWDSAAEHGMLCCAIISTLTTVVQVCTGVLSADVMNQTNICELERDRSEYKIKIYFSDLQTVNRHNPCVSKIFENELQSKIAWFFTLFVYRHCVNKSRRVEIWLAGMMQPMASSLLSQACYCLSIMFVATPECSVWQHDF